VPIYDYFCKACGKRVSVFFRSIKEAQSSEARCPSCDGTDLERRVSRFRHIKGRTAPGTDGEDLPFDESDLTALENEDPRAMARLFRRMSDEMGEPMEPDMEEVVGRLERGEAPESIEQDLETRDTTTAGDEGAASPTEGDS